MHPFLHLLFHLATLVLLGFVLVAIALLRREVEPRARMLLEGIDQKEAGRRTLSVANVGNVVLGIRRVAILIVNHDGRHERVLQEFPRPHMLQPGDPPMVSTIEEETLGPEEDWWYLRPIIELHTGAVQEGEDFSAD